jgi:hypothetical protein
MFNPAPILLIVFNRPDHTQQVLDALKKNALAKESELHIFSDAARGPRDEVAVGQVRDIIRKADGFKNIVLHESEKNKGCSLSVLSAIDLVLTLHDRCIIVEDDILTSPLFLDYMNEALTFYEKDEKIFSIGGYRSEFKMPLYFQEDVYLLSRSCAWGWGTWKRAWDKIAVDPKVVKHDLKDLKIRKEFAKHGEDWLRTFKEDPEIWDLRVSYGIWKSGMYTVLPVHSLTHNIGRDGSGIHYNGDAMKNAQAYSFPTTLPKLIHLDAVNEDVRMAFCKFTHKSIWRKIAVTAAKSLGVYKFLLQKWEKK